MRIFLIGLILIALAPLRSEAEDKTTITPAARKAALAVLRDTDDPDPDKVADALRVLITGGDKKERETALAELEKKKVQDLLSRHDVGDNPRRAEKAFLALAALPQEQAEAALLQLGKNQTLLDPVAESHLPEFFYRACGAVKKPSAKLIALLDDHLTSIPRYSSMIGQALARIGTPEAAMVLENRIFAERFPDETRDWLFQAIVTVRTRPGFFEILRRGIAANIEDRVYRDAFVKAAFSSGTFTDAEGERISGNAPQPWEAAPTDVLREAVKLADISLKQKLHDETKDLVRTARAEITRVIDDRRFQGLPAPDRREEALAAIKDSKDVHVMERGIIYLARQGGAKDVEAVVAALKTPRLQALVIGTEDSVDSSARIENIFTALAESPTRGEDALLSLGRDKGLMDRRVLNDGLCRAARLVKKPSAAFLTFLDEEMRRERTSPGTIVHALTVYGTPAAARILARHFASKEFDSTQKAGWLHRDLLTVRTRPAFFAIFKQAIMANAEDADLRKCLVETLFDYRPDLWYGDYVTDPPKPPAWADASTEVLQEVVKLADVAMKQDLPKDVKQAVRTTREEIEGILAKRAKK